MEEITFPHQIAWAMANNSLLALLTAAQQKQLAGRVALFAFGKDEALYRTGAPSDCGWAVVTGQVKIVKESGSGRRLLIEIITPNEICGGDCYSDEGELMFSAIALEGTTALRYPMPEVRTFAASNARFAQALAKDMCRRLYHAQHMRSLFIEDVAGRVACALVYLQDKFGNEIPHTRATLAELAGTTVESAIRATRMLCGKGILETGRNRMKIRSVRALKEFAHKR